jgi:hypothetical protein
MRHLPERLPIQSQVSTREYTQWVENDRSPLRTDRGHSRITNEPEVIPGQISASGKSNIRWTEFGNIVPGVFKGA